MKLEAHFFSPGRLEQAARLVAVIAHFAVGGVVEQGNVVIPAKGNPGVKILRAGYGAGRIVGVVQPHYLGRLGRIPGDGRQVGLPAVFLPQRHYVTFGPGKHRPHAVHRIGRVGNQGQIARIQKAQSRVADALFRPNQGQGFRIRVEGHAETPLVPVGNGPAHFGQPVGFRVAVIGRMLGGGQQPVNDRRRRRNIRVADAKGNYIGPGRPLLGDNAGDFHKGIGGQLAQAGGKVHFACSREDG